MIKWQIVKNKIIFAKNKTLQICHCYSEEIGKIIDFPFLQLIAIVKMGFFFVYCTRSVAHAIIRVRLKKIKT
jgi:hypothetical protein